MEEQNLTLPHKKLGAWHFIITYVWLPIMVLLYLLSFISNIVLMFTDSILAHLPNMFMDFTVFATAALACVSLITQNTKAYFLIHSFCLTLLTSYVLEYVSIIMTHKYLGQCIPVAVITMILIFIAIHKYYAKRRPCFDNLRMGTIFTNCEMISVGVAEIITYITGGIVYIYSIYYMFKISIEYGLFGVLLPGVSQLVYLKDAGFLSVYAYILYFAAIFIVYKFVLSLFADKCTAK